MEIIKKKNVKKSNKSLEIKLFFMRQWRKLTFEVNMGMCVCEKVVGRMDMSWKKKPGSLNGIKRDFSLCNWDNYLRFSIKKCLAKGNRKQNIYDLI